MTEAPGTPVSPSVFITEYGTDAQFDSWPTTASPALAACDDLYRQSPVDPSTFSYEGYGATCGGRLAEEAPGTCSTR